MVLRCINRNTSSFEKNQSLREFQALYYLSKPLECYIITEGARNIPQVSRGWNLCNNIHKTVMKLCLLGPGTI